MQRITATSADNVLMSTDATVIWRITDVATAAKNAAETISKSGSENSGGDVGNIQKLTNDVLKQAEASLASYIGAINYSDNFNVSAIIQAAPGADAAGTLGGGSRGKSSGSGGAIFDVGKMATCVEHANRITNTYGVSILSINVVAAVPADSKLQSALAQGAVAAAEANKFETVARGKANAALIEAKGLAEAGVLRAKGDAEADRIRAEGARAAADRLADSETAVRFALLEKTGEALGDKAAFFFGAQPGEMDRLFAPAAARAAGILGAPSLAP